MILAGSAIHLGGSEAQRRKILPEIISGRTRAALALTEPDPRLDAAGIATKAAGDRKRENFVLDGVKTFEVAGGGYINLRLDRGALGGAAVLRPVPAEKSTV